MFTIFFYLPDLIGDCDIRVGDYEILVGDKPLPYDCNY